MKRLLLLALCAILSANAGARTLYVDAHRPNNNGNGFSKTNAKKTIQAAINVAQKGDTILVCPGIYSSIKTSNRKITIKSVEGMSRTNVKIGTGTGVSWCLDLGAWSGKNYKGGKASSVVGFTCFRTTNYCGEENELQKKGSGCVIGGKVKQCRFVSFVSGNGWIPRTAYSNPAPRSNRALFYKATLADCEMVNCHQYTRAHMFMHSCRAQRCRVSDCGGLVSKSKLTNVLLDGGMKWPSVQIENSLLVNCTVAFLNNDSDDSSPMSGTKAYNCVFWNHSSKIGEKKAKNHFSNCWRKSADPGFVQSTNAFVELDLPNYPEMYGYWSYTGTSFLLKKGSRCIDKGKLTKKQKKLVGAKDLSGGRRIIGKTVDIGCYEYPNTVGGEF